MSDGIVGQPVRFRVSLERAAAESRQSLFRAEPDVAAPVLKD